MRRLVIIRGVPGSGKTTLACELEAQLRKHIYSAVFEADQFFYNRKNEYRFDRAFLTEAHLYCKMNTIKFLRDHPECVAIVSNTSISPNEISTYLSPQFLGYVDHVIIITCEGKFVSKHGLDENTKNNFARRYEYYKTDFLPETIKYYKHEVLEYDSKQHGAFTGILERILSKE